MPYWLPFTPAGLDTFIGQMLIEPGPFEWALWDPSCIANGCESVSAPSLTLVDLTTLI